MKFDNQLFDLSAELYQKNQNVKEEVEEEVKRKQKKVLKMILSKFKEELKSTKNNKGILKVKFESKFWSDFNDGYREIDDLINSNHFESFINEYCMYLGSVNFTCNEYENAYYEIIWDYKTYFEELRKNHTVKNNKEKDRKDEKKDFCKKNGHSFGDWKEKRWTTLEEDGPSGIESLYTGVGVLEVEHIKWSRKCKNCGRVQTTTKKPKEIEAQEVIEEIHVLQKKLDAIKNKRN